MFSFLPSIFLPNAGKHQTETRQTKMKSPEALMADYIMTKHPSAIEALYACFADDLYHYLITLSDPNLAKDIAQKTWLKIIEKPNSYHTQGSVKAWVYTIARNNLIDEYRKANRWREIDLNNEMTNIEQSAFVNDDSVYMHSQVSHEQMVSADNIARVFDQALTQLSFEQREAFCLQQEGFSINDIAQMTSSKHETIKTRLRYARDKLKQALESSYE